MKLKKQIPQKMGRWSRWASLAYYEEQIEEEALAENEAAFDAVDRRLLKYR